MSKKPERPSKAAKTVFIVLLMFILIPSLFAVFHAIIEHGLSSSNRIVSGICTILLGAFLGALVYILPSKHDIRVWMHTGYFRWPWQRASQKRSSPRSSTKPPRRQAGKKR